MSDIKKEYDLKVRCPCGSGKRYGNCCRKKRIRYLGNGKKLHKQIPMSEETELIFKYQENLFTKMYNRIMKSNDKVFFSNFVYEEQYNFEKIKALRETLESKNIKYMHVLEQG